MVRGENVFSPPTKLVVFMFASVRVWVVMRFDRSRRIHFRKKLSFQYLKGSAVCKAEKHFADKNGAPGSGPDWLYRALVVLGTGVPPFRQASFGNFRNRGLVVMRGVVEKGQARTRRVSKIDNIQCGRFLVEIIAVSPGIESK